MDQPELVRRLKELSELHAKGAITDDEFSAAKARVLGELEPGYGPPRPSPAYGGQYPPGPPGGGWVQSPHPARGRGPWILAGGAVLLVALIAVLVVALTARGTNTARGAAQAFVDAMNRADLAALREFTCGGGDINTAEGLAGGTFSLGGVHETDDETALVEIIARVISEPGSSAPAGETITLRFVRVNGAWKYCGQGR